MVQVAKDLMKEGGALGFCFVVTQVRNVADTKLNIKGILLMSGCPLPNILLVHPWIHRNLERDVLKIYCTN